MSAGKDELFEYPLGQRQRVHGEGTARPVNGEFILQQAGILLYHAGEDALVIFARPEGGNGKLHAVGARGEHIPVYGARAEPVESPVADTCEAVFQYPLRGCLIRAREHQHLQDLASGPRPHPARMRARDIIGELSGEIIVVIEAYQRHRYLVPAPRHQLVGLGQTPVPIHILGGHGHPAGLGEIQVYIGAPLPEEGRDAVVALLIDQSPGRSDLVPDHIPVLYLARGSRIPPSDAVLEQDRRLAGIDRDPRLALDYGEHPLGPQSVIYHDDTPDRGVVYLINRCVYRLKEALGAHRIRGLDGRKM